MSHQEIQQYIRNLASDDDHVREIAVVALGEIADESIEGRNLVLQAGAMQAVLSQIHEKSTLRMVRKATLTLSAFCDRKPHIAFELVRLVLPYLIQLIHNGDPVIMTDACWTLNYIVASAPEEYKQAVVDAGIISQLLALVRHTFVDVQAPALLTIAGLTSGNDLQTQYVVDSNALPCLLGLLSNPHSDIRKTSCTAISNITAGTVQQIQAVIDSHIIFPLIQLLSSAEFGERKQAAYAISNAIGGGNQQQILFIVNEGCMRPLCDLLTVADDQVVMMTLDSLEKVLMVGDEEPRRLLIAAQGLSKMKRLQMTSCNDIISKKAHEIMLMYFESEVEEVSEDELIAEMERERNFTGNVDVEDTVIEPFQDVEEASLDGYNEPAIPHRAGRKPRERTEATIEYVRNPNYLDREIRLGCPHCHRAMFIPFKFYCDPEDEGFYDPDRDPRLFQEHGMYSQCLDVELPSKRSVWLSRADIRG